MCPSPEPRFDVAFAIDQGGRAYQEDTLTVHFPRGGDWGIVALADGMGGHAAGDVASAIVVSATMDDLSRLESTAVHGPDGLPKVLNELAGHANAGIASHTHAFPETDGMGATMVTVVLAGHQMFYVSVGDSPIFLYRGGALTQINEDHSLATQIDFMVRCGMMTPEVGRDHPDRNCLISAIHGVPVPRIDCPLQPFSLQQDDILIVASDGLQFLDDKTLAAVVQADCREPAEAICAAMMAKIRDLGDPDQDNVSVAVIKVAHDRPLQRAANQARLSVPLQLTNRLKPANFDEAPAHTAVSTFTRGGDR